MALPPGKMSEYSGYVLKPDTRTNREHCKGQEVRSKANESAFRPQDLLTPYSPLRGHTQALNWDCEYDTVKDCTPP